MRVVKAKRPPPFNVSVVWPSTLALTSVRSTCPEEFYSNLLVAAISPSGRTLLSVGDSPNFYLHNIRGSSRLTFYPIATLPLPLPTNTPPHYPTTRPSTFTASFSTSFSHDSLHFAVGSQEGVVGIWDIRHAARPMKVWQADKMRAMGVGNMGAATGSISWDPSDWFHSSAPAWSIRNVKFIGGNRPDGKEYLVFTEVRNLDHRETLRAKF